MRHVPRTVLSCFVVLGMASSSGAQQASVVAASAGLTGDETLERHISWALEDTPLDRSAEQLAESTANHLARAEWLRQEIVAVEGSRTVANTLELLNELYMNLDAAGSENSLFESVHPDKSVRKAAEAGSQDVSAYATKLSLDRVVFDAIQAVDLSEADEATRYAVEKDLRSYRRAGVDKSAEVRGRIEALNKEIVELGQAFDRNIAEDIREITLVSPSQLAGLPQDYIDAHPPEADGLIRINTTYPDYIPFMRYAEDGQLRHELYLKYTNRAYPDNLDLLESLIKNRDEKAKLLGYSNWADYITEDKMIGSAQNAADFIERIADVSRASAARDYAVLLERKRKDFPGADHVADWEKGYFTDKVKSEQYSFDSQEARPYFAFERVRKGIFDVTARLFAVRYEQVQGLELWDEDVTAWDIFDGDEQLGRFFLDMHPRPDKYGHAAQFGYRSGIAGKRLPQATLVCNFPNPRTSADGVALMDFGQVSTFFHEFGHLLHTLFAGHRRWAINTGISNEWDFVEAPSQMLEEWLYDAETLQSFARHHETDEPIPESMIAKIRAASDFGKGMNTAHQAFYGALSFNCYNRDAATIDTNALVKELQARYTPFRYVDGAHFQCNFGHLNGYSAIYYTYKWSEVIAKDMFSRFEMDGVLNVETARQYRERVLAPGSSKPAAELVKDFLGRDYAFEAFQRWLDRS
jgi:thimet oligopeptidase